VGQKSGKLTKKQIDCLRLVSKQLTSKEIARELEISPYTVDQRLDAARDILGVATRRDAGRKFMLMEQQSQYESLLYEPIGIEKNSNSATFHEPRFEEEILNSEEFGNRSSAVFKDIAGHSEVNRVVPPIGGQRHNLSKATVIKNILKIAFWSMSCVSAAVMIALGIMEVLNR